MDIYREEILEHYRHPRNYGRISAADYRLSKSNTSCGDEVTIYLKLAGSGKEAKIQEIKFEGKGCALMVAAASLLTEELKGKGLEEIEALNPEAFLKTMGIEKGSAREKCLSLPVLAVKDWLEANLMKNRKGGPESVAAAVQRLREGGVIVFPTDTVWGMGVSLESEGGIEKFYALKQREKDKPTAVLVSSLAMAKRYGKFSRGAERLARNYWPGGLTLVVAAKSEVNKKILGQGATVGLRVPDHDLAGKLIEALGAGIVTGSANFTGGKAPGKFAEINKELLKKVDWYFFPKSKDNLTRAEAGGQLPSTVVETTVKPMRIIRQGAVRFNQDRIT